MPVSVLQTGGKILNRVSGDVGNSDTSYVYFALACDKNVLSWSLRYVIVASTLSFEFSNDNLPAGTHPMDATAAQLDALAWVDRTTALTGAASQTVTGVLDHDTNESFYVGRVKIVTTNATNSLALYFNRV